VALPHRGESDGREGPPAPEAHKSVTPKCGQEIRYEITALQLLLDLVGIWHRGWATIREKETV
jgi:hypothetical protein